MLDPVYTGKMVYSLFNLLEGRKPTLGYEHEGDFVKRLKGNRIMLIHTGGQLANFEPHRFDEFCQYERRGNVFDCFGDKIDSIQV